MTSAIPQTGTLSERIASVPQLADAAAAHGRVAAWLADLPDAATRQELERQFTRHPRLHVLIAALTEASPHLWDLVRADPAELALSLQSDPELRFQAILAAASQAGASSQDETEIMALLRRMKSQAALLIGLADLGAVWPVMRVTAALTDLADAAVGGAVRFLLGDAARRGWLRPPVPAQPEIDSGYIVLAMGKMGAHELNYSSDIDLIIFYDAAAAALAPDVEPAAHFVRLTRRLVKMLQERTPLGYVFRTDLRLRPDPSSTQIAVSTIAALGYYERVGQNWERAAMIKARPCAGDLAAGRALLHDLSPFIWRKHLDFAAVADIHAMKRQIHAYRGHAEIAVEGHNIKLGRGGIREIEFFVQTQQLIAAGRHPELRSRETLVGLAALAEGGWIDRDAGAELGEAYRFLRVVENRLQMVADEQTHSLPTDPEALAGFARFLGCADRDEFARLLLLHLGRVQRHYASLFEHGGAEQVGQPSLSFPPASDHRETLDRLVELGFQKPLEVSALVRQWLAGGHRPLKGEAVRSQLAALVPLLLRQFARSPNPEAALIGFDRFLAGLHSPGGLFSLLLQNPDLVALIALVLGAAPRLADGLAQFPQVMDALIDPGFFGALPDDTRLAANLGRSLAQSDTYEDFLDRIRIFGQEQMFLIGTRILSGTLSAEQAGDAYARLADTLILALDRAVADRFAEQHGRVAGQATAILALGKLGGREMTATSDLDLICIYEFESAHPESDGPRVLTGPQYFARLIQRLISALTAQTTYGVLYQVDMRLRPSGRSGPLATRIESFTSYQETEAWTWEHMALTRARVISAPPAFATRIEAAIRQILCRPRVAALVAADVVEMRSAIAAEKGDGERWDLKYVAGGLIDVEFIAQYLQLVHAAVMPDILDTSTARVLDKAWRLELISTEDAEVLRMAVRLYHDLTQILRLCLPGKLDPAAVAPELARLLVRAADVPDLPTLDAFLGETQAKVRRSFIHILGRAP
jgi:glutamate-ammonia-ligase adenylyltransferase